MGILSGAMAGLGGGLADIGSMHIKKEAELDYQREIMALREQADVRADERRQRIKRDDDQYAFDQEVARAPQRREMKAEDELTLGEAKRKVKTGEMVDKLGFETENIQQITANERAKADATDRDKEGRALRNDLTREQIEDRGQARKERDERFKIVEEHDAAVKRGDKAGAASAKERLEVHNRKYGRHMDEANGPIVQAARAILNDTSSSEEERAAARRKLRSLMGGDPDQGNSDPLGLRKTK